MSVLDLWKLQELRRAQQSAGMQDPSQSMLIARALGVDPNILIMQDPARPQDRIDFSRIGQQPPMAQQPQMPQPQVPYDPTAQATGMPPGQQGPPPNLANGPGIGSRILSSLMNPQMLQGIAGMLVNRSSPYAAQGMLAAQQQQRAQQVQQEEMDIQRQEAQRRTLQTIADIRANQIQTQRKAEEDEQKQFEDLFKIAISQNADAVQLAQSMYGITDPQKLARIKNAWDTFKAGREASKIYIRTTPGKEGYVPQNQVKEGDPELRVFYKVDGYTPKTALDEVKAENKAQSEEGWYVTADGKILNPQQAAAQGLNPNSLPDGYDGPLSRQLAVQVQNYRTQKNSVPSVDQQGMEDWIKKHPGKGPADYVAWKSGLNKPNDIPPFEEIPIDPNSTTILAQTGLSYPAFQVLTGNASSLPRDRISRSRAFGEAQQWAVKHGVDVATMASQYKSYNDVLSRNISRMNNTRIMEAELQGTIENLQGVVQEADLKKLRFANVAKIWAGQEVNDPLAQQYAMHLFQLRNELAAYGAATQGRSGNEITLQDMKEAENVIRNGVAAGSLDGLSKAVENSTSKMGTVMQKSVDTARKSIWDLFGVGGNYPKQKRETDKPSTTTKAEEVRVVMPDKTVNIYDAKTKQLLRTERQ